MPLRLSGHHRDQSEMMRVFHPIHPPPPPVVSSPLPPTPTPNAIPTTETRPHSGPESCRLQAVEFEAPVHSCGSNELGVVPEGHPRGQATVLCGETRQQ